MNLTTAFTALRTMISAAGRRSSNDDNNDGGRRRWWWPVVGAAAVSAGYVKFLRPRLQRWGATDDEVQRPMLGDGLVHNPTYVTTRAIGIDTAPGDVWPWIVQMGEERGGFYSYDVIDRLLGMNVHSAQRILPRYQELDVGQPLARNGQMIVRGIEAGQAIVIGPSTDITDVDATWTIAIYPDGRQQTRLVSRTRARFDFSSPRALLWFLLLDPGQFVMEQKFLREIKTRAEGRSEKWPYEGAPTLH